MNDAIRRLEASRARLRDAMLPPRVPKAGDAEPPPPASWLERIRAMPLVGQVLGSVGAWWNNHPWRPIVAVAGEASNAVVKPLARRSPWALVAAAGAAGALFALAKPWRWAFRSALFAGLMPQIASRVVSNLPIESWMTMLGAALATSPTGPPAGSTAAPPD